MRMLSGDLKRTQGRRKRGQSLLVCGLIGVFIGVSGVYEQGEAQERDTPSAEQPVGKPTVQQGAFVGNPVSPMIFEADLRTLPRTRGWRPGDLIREVPQATRPPRGKPQEPANQNLPVEDPLLEFQDSLPEDEVSRTFSPPDASFAGMSFTGARPPDTIGDVGLVYYIQMVNDGLGGSSFSVYDKAGTLVVGPTSLQSLWTGGGECAAGRGDPIVLYDHLASRWLMSEVAATGGHLCVYISRTTDPITGGWFLYDFATPALPDFPKYAVWPDAYYVSTNESSPAAYALDRISMLAGLTATSQRFTAPSLAGFGFQALIPSDLDGPMPPPAGTPNYFMRHRDDEVHTPGSNDATRDFIEIWEFRVDFATPANSSFTGPIDIPVAEFDSDVCGLTSFECFPQPGTSQLLDPLREVMNWRLQYRQMFGSQATLVGNFTVDVDGTDRGGIRWFELRSPNPGAIWELFQEGTHSPDTDPRWMGSIAMDKTGNIALGYSVSNASSVFPSIRYAGRRESDVLGTLPQGEVSLIAGGRAQTGSSRWGDYSSMNVDPVDDCTFWYTNEYIAAGSSTWRTWIGKFSFPSCTGSFGGWDEVPGGGLALSGPEIIRFEDERWLFVRGLEGRIFWKVEIDGVWTGWAEVPSGGVTLGSPGAVVLDGILYLFVQGTDFMVYVNTYDGTSWSGWSAVPGGGTTLSGPSAAVLDGLVYLFVQGTDLRIYVNTYDGTSWSGWSEVAGGGLTLDKPEAIIYEGILYLVVRGIDSRIYENLLTGAGWSGWAEVAGGGATLSYIGASVFDGGLDYFVQGTDLRIYQNRLPSVGAARTGWSQVPGGGATLDGPGASGGATECIGMQGTDLKIYINRRPVE